MSVDERILAVIQVLYDAALDETLWPKALQELVDFTRSQGASFWTLESSEQPRLPIFTTFNFDDRFIRDYLESMVPLDPTVQYLVHHPDEPIVHDGLVITERDKDFDPYYDWQSRQSDIHFRMVGQTRPTPTVQAGVALHRTRKTGRYEPADLERFALIHGHLQKALAIGIRLGSLGATQRCTSALLDRHPAAILLLDEHKRIVYANRRAEALRAAVDGVQLSGRGLVLARKQDNDKLQTLIAGVLSGAALPGVGGVMRAPRPSGKRAYGILVAPHRRPLSGTDGLPSRSLYHHHGSRDQNFSPQRSPPQRLRSYGSRSDACRAARNRRGIAVRGCETRHYVRYRARPPLRDLPENRYSAAIGAGQRAPDDSRHALMPVVPVPPLSRTYQLIVV